MIRLVTAFLVIVISVTNVAGQQREIDSLTNSLDKVSSSGVDRIDLLLDLADAYYDNNTERAYEYATQAYSLANEAKDNTRLRRSLTLQGFYFFSKGEFDKAISYYERAASIDEVRDELFGYNLVMKANAYRSMALYDSADRYYVKALKLFNEIKSEQYIPFTYKSQVRLLLLRWRNDEAQQVLSKAIPLYQRRGDQNGLADTWFLMAQIHENKAEYAKATSLIEEGCKIGLETKDEFLNINCLVNRGKLKYKLGEYPEALRIYIEALGVLKSKDLPLYVTQLYNNIGDVYRSLGDHEVAFRYYNEAIKIAKKINVPYEEAKILNNIAAVLRNQGSLEKAEQHLKESMDIRTRLEDEHGLSMCYTALGQIRLQQKNLPEAERYQRLSLDIRRKLNYREGVSANLYNLSLIYATRKDLETALQYQMQAFEIEKAIGNKFTMGFSQNRLAKLFIDLGRFDLAEQQLRSSEQIAKESGSRTLAMMNALNWSEYFDRRGNAKASLEKYKRYNAIQDSIQNDIEAQKLAELQALYMMDKKDQEIAMLNQERQIQSNEIQLQRSRINLQNLVIIGGVFGLGLLTLLGVVHYGYTSRLQKANREITEQKEEIQSQSEELIEANHTIAEINKKLEQKIEDRTKALSQAYKELDTFFYRSSHDFRRPLTTFLGLAEVAKVTVKDQNALELFDKVKETAYNLDKMLVKLQSISDVGSQQLVYKQVFIKEIFETVCDGFREEIQRRNIMVSADVKLQDSFVSYPAMVKIIIENLVENAISFSNVEKPFIKLRAMQSGNYVTIEIQDNGQGIAKEFQDQIFDMYYRANERSKGNGLGLYIVKKAVEKLDGSISVSSVIQAGTTFTVMLPLEVGKG